MRPMPFLEILSSNAWRLVSKSTVQALGSPAFLFQNMFGTVVLTPL